MGCWNETCGLSHLQILSGDNIVCLILLKTQDLTRTCYYNQSYVPLCLPIEGTYDDYGGIENIKISDYSLEFLKKIKFFKKPYNKEDFEEYKFETVEQLIYDIRDTDENIYIDYGIGENHMCKLSYAYYHKELYDTIVEDFKKRKVYEKKETIFELYQTKHSKVKDDILKIAELNKQIKDEDECKDHDLVLEVLDLKWEMRDKLFKSSHYGFSFPIEYINRNVITSENIDSFFDELTLYIMFARSLSYGRYGFNSISGMGGQDLDVRVQELVAKFILKFIKRTWEEGEKIYTKKETLFWWED